LWRESVTGGQSRERRRRARVGGARRAGSIPRATRRIRVRVIQVRVRRRLGARRVASGMVRRTLRRRRRFTSDQKEVGLKRTERDR
uniref:Protamine n=1 Tax=Anisakis simplex TaxID=6269 RepID=A0A0M3JD88_ANISI